MHQIYGLAWTGTGCINNVEISTNGGENWRPAVVQPMSQNAYSWTFWNYMIIIFMIREGWTRFSHKPAADFHSQERAKV
ncbi:hypothetical protein [Paenibacillus tyrfis]|uniref:hypothetical protein n=1 Tax=Paenibacillus tyrfis TaxID=1501230 RepID=UPI0039B79317